MKEKLDVLLVNPGGRRGIYQSLSTRLSAIEPPIWAGLIATFVRRAGCSVDVLDANAEEFGPEETAEQIVEADPTLTVVVVYGHNPSASTQVMPSARAICTSLKRINPEARVLLVGGHVAALPERTLREEEADFVCQGEGVYTILDLLHALKTPRPDFSEVRDLWYWENGNIKTGPSAYLVKDLDSEMPGLAWDLLPMEKYRAHNWHCFGNLQRQPYAALYTTFGCPYHCSFCCIQAPFKNGERALGHKKSVKTYRSWNPKVVIAQIDKLVQNYGVRNIKFADEMFVLNARHVLGICDLIIERGYDLNLWAYARVDSVRTKMLDKLKQAGFNWIALGIESGSHRVRHDAHKGFREDDVHKAIELVRRAGIHVIGNYMFGLPEDDLETMQATLDLAVELNCEFANFASAMAYPGSELYDIAVREGWPLPEHWNGYSQYSEDTLPIPTKHLSAPEVLRFRDHAFQTYFTNPRYLEMIDRTFGPETAQHIRQMTSKELVRRYA